MDRADWTQVFSMLVFTGPLGGLTNFPVGYFTVPLFTLAPTFRVVLEPWTAGSITVKLRFGFTEPDTDVSGFGLDFATLNSPDASSLASPVFDVGAVFPGTIGSPLSVIPPLARILITVPKNSSMTFSVYFAGVFIP